MLKMCLILVSCLAFITACEKDNNSELNGGNVALLSFGPCPIQRGAELRIIGTNLDKVTSVNLPGTAPITGSDIKEISSSEIRVIVPQDATPGIISIQAGNQDQIFSKTPLTFSEPIIISSITPLTVKPGVDAIKITGDYLNLIEEIIFTDNVHVVKANFASQSRQEIDLTVPQTARTGTIILSNGADIVPDANGNYGIPLWIYSTDTLNVMLPTVASISPNPIKAGAELTITGTNFDLVDSVAFGGNVGVGIHNFVSITPTQIQVNVPANATDGVAKVIAFSGVEVESSDTLKLVVPTISGISPNPVKNGATLTVTGKDLDLISSVVFTGSKSDSTTLILSGGTASQIQVSVPTDAADGVVTFHTLANKSIQSEILEFIVPTITNISPTSILAGDPVTITGTDLDLVASLTMGGVSIDKKDFVSQSTTQIGVQSLASSAVGAGNIVLTTINGTQITSTQQITINTPNIPAITSISPSPVKPGAMLSIRGTKLNLVNSVVFMDASGSYTLSAIQYGSRIDSLIEVYVPQGAKAGTVTLALITYDGKQYVSPSFAITGTDPVVDPSLMIFDFDDSQDVADFRWSGVGQKSTDDGIPGSGAFYEVTATYPVTGDWQWLFADNWAVTPTIPQVSGLSNYVLKMDVRLRNDIPISNSWCQLQFNFASQSVVVDIAPYLEQGNVFSTGGEWTTITIPLTSVSGLPDPTPTGGQWGLNVNQGGGDISFIGLCIDNIRYEHM